VGTYTKAGFLNAAQKAIGTWWLTSTSNGTLTTSWSSSSVSETNITSLFLWTNGTLSMESLRKTGDLSILRM
jgi:hypothetical protein